MQKISVSKVICTASAALAIASGIPAFTAETDKGFYGTIGAGLFGMKDTDWDFTTGGTKYTGDFSYDSGFSAEIGVGYNFGNQFRSELTYTRHTGDLDSVKIDQAGFAVTGTGNIHVDSIMTSLYYDIDTGESQITPYFGGGIGYSNITTEDGTIAGVAVNGGSVGAFGYHLKLGASFPVHNSTDIYGEFGYAGTADITSHSVNYSNIGGYGGQLGLRFKM